MSATTTEPAPRWQAVEPSGIGHTFFVMTPGIGHAACDPQIRPVAERWEYPVIARCTRCMAVLTNRAKTPR